MNKLFLILLVFTFLGGCMAGSGEGLDENGNPPSNNSTEVEEPEIQDPIDNIVTLNSLVADIFSNPELGGQRCANCHGGGSPLGGMNLETLELAAANLLGVDGTGVAANGNASFLRVNPGKPDESYLILKLEGDSRAGSQMPLAQPPLKSEQIALIRDWIANGAPLSGEGENAAKVSGTQVKKTEKGKVNLQIRFSKNLQIESVSSDVVQVTFQRNGVEWLALSENYQLSAEGKNLNIFIHLTEPELDGLLVVVNNESLGTLLDSNGRPVDGNGDEFDGGAFRYEYKL